MILRLNEKPMPAKFTLQTIDQFKWMFNRIYENDRLGIIDNQLGPAMVVLVTRLLEEGARSKNKEINFVWQDVYRWIDKSYNEEKWNKNLKIILKNFYYFQNEN